MKAKIRLLILTFYYPPDLCAGSFRASSLINGFKKKRFNNLEIDIITTMPNRYHSFERPANALEKQGNINIYRIKLPVHKNGIFDQARAFCVYFFSSLKLVRKKKYDIVFATSSRLFTAFLGTIAAMIKRAGLYLDIRDIFTDTMNSMLTGWKKIFLPVFVFIEKFTIKASNRVNIVSPGFESHFRSMVSRKKISYFTNGIDEIFLHHSFDKTKTSNKKIITYAGNIGQGQGLEKIIPGIALGLKEKACFRLVGDGGMRSILQKKVKELGLNNVEFISPVDRAELIAIYRESDYLFLHLNDWPAFEKVLPSKLFEYAATEKPILAGVKGYAKNFIAHHLDRAMIFEPCSPESFCEKFDAFLNLDTLPGRKRAQFINKYNRGSIMDKMVEDLLRLGN